MTTALATTQSDAALAKTGSAELTVQDLIAQVRKVQEVMQAVMKDGEHYGVIPGTKSKPTLLKPGAEKLCLLFRLDPEYELIERAKDGDHLTITARCVLYHAPTGERRGSGLGSCSSRESKYAYRKGERKCPRCSAEAIIRGKEEYGGGWLCFGKKGGCGAKFKAGDQSIEGQPTDRVANPDLADTYNTVLKMATKRALIAAVLNVTAASDIFTQDLEDLPVADGEQQEPPPKRSNVSPHLDDDESWRDPPPPGSPFDSIMAQLVDIETRIDTCDDFFEAKVIREELGSKAHPTSRLCKEMQTARMGRACSPEQRKQIGATWQRADRKLSKLEERLKPGDAADAFIDPPEADPENDGR